MFNQLIEDEESNFNPAANIGKLGKKRNEDSEQIEALKQENVYDMKQVVTALDKAKEISPRYHPVFACGFLSGLRMGEQIALRPIDIVFDSNVIEGHRNFYRDRITMPKGNRRRKVDLEPELENIFQELISAKKAAALRNEMKKPAPERRGSAQVVQDVMEDYLFTTPAGTHLDPSNLGRAFNSVLKQAKLPRIRYHDMWHSYATNMLKAGVGIDKVKTLLGHSSIQITVDTYGHFVPGKERQSALTDAIAAARQQKHSA
jgi:integrase